MVELLVLDDFTMGSELTSEGWLTGQLTYSREIITLDRQEAVSLIKHLKGVFELTEEEFAG